MTKINQMNVHQLSATYLAEQDRILVRINTTDAQELRLWLTRRLLLGLRPLLDRLLTDQLMLPEASVTSGAAADESMKKMLADFRKAELMNDADFDTPYQAQQASLPLGEEPLLVTDVNLTPQPSSRMGLEFFERLPGTPEPRSFKLELEPRLMQGFLHLLGQALGQAAWQSGEAPAATEAEALAPDAPGSGRPRYLN